MKVKDENKTIMKIDINKPRFINFKDSVNSKYYIGWSYSTPKIQKKRGVE